MGLVILGQALTTHPKLFAEETWAWHEFTAADNTNWQQFRLESMPVGHIPPMELLNSLDNIIDKVQVLILRIIAEAKPQSIVAGTVRLYVSLSTDGVDSDKSMINLWLMWISQNEED